MITEALLVLPLYLILFFVWWRFQPLIKAKTDVGDIFDDDSFDDIIDTPKKRECLKSVIDKGKGYFLGGKWTHERVEKASDETINKKYAEYKQHELNKKGENIGKTLGKHVINLFSTGISRWLKIKDVKKLHQGIENDPIIKDQIAALGCCLIVCTFGDYLTSILIAAHTANNVDFGDEQGHENEGYEND